TLLRELRVALARDPRRGSERGVGVPHGRVRRVVLAGALQGAVRRDPARLCRLPVRAPADQPCRSRAADGGEAGNPVPGAGARMSAAMSARAARESGIPWWSRTCADAGRHGTGRPASTPVTGAS